MLVWNSIQDIVMLIHQILYPLVSMTTRIVKYKNRRGKSKTIVGEIPTIDFMLFLIFLSCKMGVLNEKRCKIINNLIYIYLLLFINKF